MVKSISSAMQSALAQNSTTLARCWKIVRTDGEVFTFTTADFALLLPDGNTYEPTQGFTSTAIENKSDFSVDNVDVQGIFDSESITVGDLRAGLFDYADIFVYVVDWTNLEAGVLNLRRGKLGEVISSPQGWFQVELRGMTQLLQQQMIELYGPECRADLGDARCTVPIDPPLWTPSTAFNTVVNQVNTGAWVKAPTVSGTGYQVYGNVIFECTTAGTTGTNISVFSGVTTPGTTVTDGGVTWTCRQAWTHDGVIASVLDALDVTVTFSNDDSRDVDQWYQYGIMVFDTGSNKGKALEIKNWVKLSRTATFYVPAGYPVQVGDIFHLAPGCDKSLSMCQSKFNNLLNMRAEPYLPGNDFAFYYPDAQGRGNQG